MMAGRIRFNSNPSSPYLKALEAVQQLAELEGISKVHDLFGDVWHEHGAESYLEDQGVRKTDHSSHHVAKLLAGVPEQLVEANILKITERFPELLERWPRKVRSEAKRSAARDRQEIIGRIAAGSGWADHVEVFSKDRQTFSIVGHPYDLHLDDLQEIVALCTAWNLDVHISGASWYYPGWTSKVEIYRDTSKQPTGANS